MTPADRPPGAPRVVIAGFGLPGRAVADVLRDAGVPHAVIERNPKVCDRCTGPTRRFVQGDVRDERVLRDAGVDHAEMLALMIPGDTDVLAAVDAAMTVNPRIRCVVRAMYTSIGMAAMQRPNVIAIVAEQLVAREAAKIVSNAFPRA